MRPISFKLSYDNNNCVCYTKHTTTLINNTFLFCSWKCHLQRTNTDIFHINAHEPIWQNTKTFIKSTTARWSPYRQFEIKHYLIWQNILFLSTVNGQKMYFKCGVRDKWIVNSVSVCLKNLPKVAWWKRLTHKLRNEPFKLIHHTWKVARALETHRVEF